MATFGISEYDVELATLAWLEDVGWQIAHGPDVAPDAPSTERDNFGQVVLQRRLREALSGLNPRLPRPRRKTPSVS